MRHKKIFLFVFSLIALGIACSTFGGSNADNNSNGDPSNQNAAPTPTATQSISDSSISSEEEQQQELPPVSYEEILQTGIETGLWTEEEGYLLILGYFTGEVSAEEIPGVEQVAVRTATGMIRQLHEFLQSQDISPEGRSELERLFRKISPPQEVLDLISEQRSASSSIKLAAIQQIPEIQTRTDCIEIADLGYDEDTLDRAAVCYYYREMQFSEHTFRIYYPFWWEGEGPYQDIVNNTFDAIMAAAGVYSGFQSLEIKDINLVFAIEEDPTAYAFQSPFDIDEQACPLTVFPDAIADNATEKYQQIIAHEMFHCVQDFSFPNTSPYDTHRWWLEGTADYFSNLVFPTANEEWGTLSNFNSKSTSQSIFEMAYENFVFFQFMGNKYSPQTLVNILQDISAAGAQSSQQTVLSNVPDIETNFNLFVVEFLSTGVADSGGGMITVAEAEKTGTKTISEKGEQSFSTKPFVATRYKVDYQKEKRFLQTDKELEGGSFSAAEYSWHKNLYSWSDLPPEVRSYCKEDLPYYFVVTTTESGNFEYIADVTLTEKAVCDPCLLGVWAVNNDSFEDYILRIMEDSGEMPDLNGAEIALEIEGRNYLEFKVEGKLNTRRDAFAIATGLSNTENWITTIIDSQGTGTYSADGEELKVFGLTDYVNSITAQVGGVPISMSQTPGATTVNIFGQTANVPGASGAGISDGPQQASASYVCGDETLTVDQPDYGELLFDRVDEILPTPIPTPGSPDLPQD